MNGTTEIPPPETAHTALNVLSYHLLIESGRNRIYSGKPSGEDVTEIQAADAVILPQGGKESLYRLARQYCTHVFPNYDAFFSYPGKTGQATLFKMVKVPHPHTLIFENLACFAERGKDIRTYPFVFKFAWGGEGNNVFFVQSEPELDTCLDLAKKWEGQGKKGFVIQEYIPSAGRSLRVVVIGSRFISYWRTHQDQNSFYSNISRGAEIDKDNDPDLQEDAVRELKKFCERTKINLAGFDFLFDSRQKKPTPLFLEINYFFRCHGLGGTDRYFELLVGAVNEWLAGIKTDGP